MSDLWEYGGAYKDLDMSGEIALPNGSVVSVCDLVERMPDYMKRADTLFVDPPWNTGNIRSFYTKADEPLPVFDFLGFTAALWGRIDEIKPRTLFVEMGKQHLWRYLEQAERRYKYVTFYNSTYYDKRDNLTYVIHATDDHATRRHKALEGMDEARIIAWICANTDYGCIGDLCMGPRPRRPERLPGGQAIRGDGTQQEEVGGPGGLDPQGRGVALEGGPPCMTPTTS